MNMEKNSASEIDERKQQLEEVSCSEFDKGKQPLDETSAEESTSRGRPDSLWLDQRSMNEKQLPDRLDGDESFLALLGFVRPTENIESEVWNPFHSSKLGEASEKSGKSSINSMANGKRGICQLPNLDLSLLPPRMPMGSLRSHHRGQPAASPQQHCPVPFSPIPNLFRSPTAGAEQPPCANLTIFYAGKVNVYNVPADKAKDIMAVASRISANSLGSGNAGTSSSSAPSTPLNSAPGRSETMSPVTPFPSPIAEAIVSRVQSAQTINSAALPISRKFSIRRFLEKRNDRLYGRAPYALPPQN